MTTMTTTKVKPVRLEFYVNHNRKYVDEAWGTVFREEHLDGPFRSEDRAWKVCVRRRKQGFEAFVATFTRWPEDKSPRFAGGTLTAAGTTPDAG